MKPSPIGSKVLSGYAAIFSGLAPVALVTTALINGVVFLPSALGNIAFGGAIVYFGVRVFAGDYSSTRIFALLVALNYLGLTVINLWHFNDFPADSRPAQMAVPRIIRGVLFASVYIWYYFIRKRTVFGFLHTDAKIEDQAVYLEGE